MPRLVYPKFQTYVYKPKSSSDSALVPAAATLEFHRQGATVRLGPSESIVVPPLTDDSIVPVYDAGMVRVGDLLAADGGAPILTCTYITSSRQIVVANLDDSASVTLTNGVRLVNHSDRPTVYATGRGDDSLGSSVTTDALGCAQCYVEQNRFDYFTNIEEEPQRLTIDASPSFGRSDNTVINVRDFPSLQAAIDALPPEGGTVFLPAGTHTLTSGVVINRPGITLLGDGQATRIEAGTVDAFDLITVNAGFFKMRDITVDGMALTGSGTKRCIVMNGLGASGNLVLHCRLENLIVQGAPAHGLHLIDMITFSADNCQFVFNRQNGVMIQPAPVNPQGATSTKFTDCGFSQNQGVGLRADQVFGLLLQKCTGEGNKGGWGEQEGTSVFATSCGHIELSACAFEDPPIPSGSSPPERTTQIVYLDTCLASIVDGCIFYSVVDSSTH